jgi:ferredoxin-type protein NapG
MLAAADPSAKDRELPPGYGRLENHPRRRGQIPVLRPPGAVAEAQFLEMCTRCDACLDACPHGSIKLAPHRFKDAAGTPMIDAFDAPCHMCDDMPCISACEPGALSPDVPKKIGIAHLQTYNCLAHNRTICTVCEERCPVDGAIELHRGRPRIIDENCTGCGVCHSVCPAPVNAIMIMPVPNRPEATYHE